jgi:DNA-binding response OmpR family regulator
MPVKGLVVCRDEDALRVLRRALEELGIEADLCGDAEQALAAVRQQKYDTLIVDCDDLPGGAELMRSLRRGSSNRAAIGFAITNGTSVRAAFDLGANFVLEKPIAFDRAIRGLRAAHGLMMRERRRYLRQSVNVPALVTLNDGMEVRATIIDVSEGGMSVRGIEPSLQGTVVRMHFGLPDARRNFDVRAEVSWTGPEGRAGMRFSTISDTLRAELTRWLQDQAQQVESGAMHKSVVGS